MLDSQRKETQQPEPHPRDTVVLIRIKFEHNGRFPQGSPSWHFVLVRHISNVYSGCNCYYVGACLVLKCIQPPTPYRVVPTESLRTLSGLLGGRFYYIIGIR